MDKQKALEETREEYEKSLKQIEVAFKISEEINPFLPEGWMSYFFAGDILEFKSSNSHATSPAEFRTVADLVEKITGQKLSRCAKGDKKHQKLTAFTFAGFDGIWLSLYVEASPDDTCKFTFKRTWTVEPVADERCLGIRKEA